LRISLASVEAREPTPAPECVYTQECLDAHPALSNKLDTHDLVWSGPRVKPSRDDKHIAATDLKHLYKVRTLGGPSLAPGNTPHGGSIWWRDLGKPLGYVAAADSGFQAWSHEVAIDDHIRGVHQGVEGSPSPCTAAWREWGRSFRPGGQKDGRVTVERKLLGLFSNESDARKAVFGHARNAGLLGEPQARTTTSAKYVMLVWTKPMVREVWRRTPDLDRAA